MNLPNLLVVVWPCMEDNLLRTQVLRFFPFWCSFTEATTEDMPPLEGEEDDDASRMEEVD